MFLDKYGIKLYIRDDFSINLCGVEDSVENYQTYLTSCCAAMVFESYGIIFFSFCHSYLDFYHDLYTQLCFHSHFSLNNILLKYSTFMQYIHCQWIQDLAVS